mmetsp:Transcript_9698/g.19077  ORF Transcript_9698/g.19077 Transcript_9698/m.19077 type:complete len:89 (+) Transcript_9698:2413-2679(+)
MRGSSSRMSAHQFPAHEKAIYGQMKRLGLDEMRERCQSVLEIRRGNKSYNDAIQGDVCRRVDVKRKIENVDPLISNDEESCAEKKIVT